MNRLLYTSLSLAVLLSSSACGVSSGQPSEGELGNAQFAWDDGVFGCLFGCDADEPMVAHAVAYLQVLNDEDLPAFTVESSNSEVFEATDAGSFIRLDSHASGEAKVVLVDAATGEVVDRFEVSVRDVAAIEVGQDGFQPPFHIMTEGEVQISLTLKDDRGNRLKGVGGVDYTLSGDLDEERATLITALADLIASVFAGTSTEYVSVEALDVGSGSITAVAASGATLSVPVAVVDASAIDRVTVSGIDSDTLPAPGESTSVNAQAFSLMYQVHSPTCAWSLSPEEGAVRISSTGRDYLSVIADAPGTATATCTIGDQSASMQIEYR
jgi:hypothetical protein